MKILLSSAKPVIIAVAAAVLTSLYAVSSVKPVGDWRTQFKKLIPSFSCVLGRKSCSEQQINIARAKVRAYVALFGTAAAAYGIRMYMTKKADAPVLTSNQALPGGSYFDPIQRSSERPATVVNVPVSPPDMQGDQEIQQLPVIPGKYDFYGSAGTQSPGAKTYSSRSDSREAMPATLGEFMRQQQPKRGVVAR